MIIHFISRLHFIDFLALMSVINRTADEKRSLLAKAVFGLDRRLQSRSGVFCYSSDPKCIFRISLTELQSPATLDWWTTLPQGAKVAELHLWNEQLPLLSEYESPVAWALALSRSLANSLRLFSAYLAEHPELDSVRAIKADMALGAPEMTERLLSLTARYGFTPCGEPFATPGFGRRLGENILISMMILARNPGGFRLSMLRRTRVRVFMRREVLDQRFKPVRLAP